MNYFPSHLQIEVVAGICSADCIMCTIKEVSRKGVLSLEKYSAILDRFVEHVDKLKFLTLHGMGEPLLDKTLPEKIALARDKGFPGIGFATNATHLSTKVAASLLESGLNTIIFSIDGIKKETHEKIRKVNYDTVLRNILNFIDLRNSQGKTKIIMRMIRQEENKNEWDEYQAFWLSHLNKQFGDQVSFFDVHNWGVRAESREQRAESREQRAESRGCMIYPEKHKSFAPTFWNA